jgi:hypothetical protein
MLYCARLARPDWMFAINLLTRKLTVWDSYCDKAFNRLMCYATQTQNYTLKGHVGSEPLILDLYCDADHAGCKVTARSTSGVWLEGRSGANSLFPLDWVSKRQGQVAFSTPEAELVSLDLAIRSLGIPVGTLTRVAALNKGLRECALPVGSLIEAVVKTTVPIYNLTPTVYHEDNTATITIVEKGRSPSLRHLNKTHRISIFWVAEVLRNKDLQIKHCDTLLQKGDGFTKDLDRLKFNGMLGQLGIG